MTLFADYVHRGRLRRFAAFTRDLAKPSGRPLRILDVGGTWSYWSAMPWKALGPIEVVLLNVSPQEVPAPFSAVVGDARDLSRYASRSFDVVFSNSVIGHVGSLVDQARMAAEIQRVGRTYVLQTPNHRFPLDWRTLMPFFHWLTPDQQAWCFKRFRVGVYPRARNPELAEIWSRQVRNLTHRELVGLFPGASITRERVAGFTKSFIVRGAGGK